MSGTIGNNIGYSSGSITAPSGGVEIRSDDPTLSEGLMWYNTAANTLKVARTVAAWSAGGALNTGRSGSSGSNGTQSACFVAGGSVSGGGRTGTSETYNGSAWANQGALTGAARTGASNFGTNTAGCAASGWSSSVVNITNEFDGTSWTDVSATLIQGGYEHGTCGTQTAGLKVGAYNDVTMFDECEEYDGSSWAAAGLISASTYSAQTGGTQTSAVNGGGFELSSNAVTAVSQTYDGTSWSGISALSTARRSAAAFGASDSDCNINGGYGASADLTSTEIWNGSSWASGGTRGNALRQIQGCGNSSSSGLTAGGTSYVTTTEEYSEALAARSVTAS